MKRVEIVTPKGEVLWVGAQTHTSMSMYNVVDAFRLTIREVPEPYETVLLAGSQLLVPLPAGMGGRKVRVRSL